MDEAARLRVRADRAARLCDGLANDADRAKLRAIADQWDREATEAEEADAQDAEARQAPGRT